MINFLNYLISKVLGFLVNKDFIRNKINDKDSQKIIALYSKSDYTRNFVKFRFWFGPLHEINRLAPSKGLILDLGSGEGILANFLAISKNKRKIIGVELSKNRIKEANKKIPNIKFVNDNALSKSLPKADAIVISHVLHHLGSKDLQEKLIKNCLHVLKKNGELIIAEVNRQYSIRYLFGWIVDIFLVPVFFEKKLLDLKIYHRGKNEWLKIFTDYGYKIKKVELTSDRIYPEVIFVLTK